MSRKACCLCEDAEAMLADFVTQRRCSLDVVDVDQQIALAASYGMDVPVLLFNGQIQCMHRIHKADVEKLLVEVGAC
ncbi:MAG: glutaredoxin family protein [Mariprofundaceae bacterium]|nr:glutaredoxin family protein [Mariprofundaceae bacterium]